jgi:dTDP-4-amino-4,6-dideoxygalactose transaminase
MLVPKRAVDESRFRRSYTWYASARDAFKSYLKEFAVGSGRPVLLPAYIGWSPREGSGVFDPIRELGLPFDFYRVNDRLELDLSHVEELLRSIRPAVFVLIHYFGRVDPAARAAASAATAHGIPVLEDEAHALFSDLVSGDSGRLGDACVLSLHKLLPVEGGGVLVLNRARGADDDWLDSRLGRLWSYDLPAIAARRVRNAMTVRRLLASGNQRRLEPLWPDWPSCGIPQSYPVLVHSTDRDELYQRMNEAGYGVVSLYHTLIDEIDKAAFPASSRTSSRIMNLPVHQDLDEDALDKMIRYLNELL